MKNAAKQDVLRAIARLHAQACLNVAESDRLGRVAESLAWDWLAAYLQWTAGRVAEHGPRLQGRLF